jgi:PTH1 family peptidyl-tRNA hydrolase
VLWYRMHRTEKETVTKVIVGLGNPGKSYERNRHNAGFMVLEALAREGSGTWSSDGLSRTCRLGIGNYPVLLVEPLTFMNLSGNAVYNVLSRVHRDPRDLVVLLDDLNLQLGRIRIRERGSAGGHHGLESILAALNTDEVVRVRMGVAEEQMPEEKSGFVLSDFPPERKTDLDAMITKAGNAVKSILSDGVSKTMAIFNA